MKAEVKKVLKLSCNQVGRDFVVGDLHGCYELLRQLMDYVEFDYRKDRLFAVGDLIDRGSRSLDCLKLLQENWFYSIQGNHEAMMLDFFSSYLKNGHINDMHDHSYSGFLDNGGAWIIDYFEPTSHSMTQEFTKCLHDVVQLPVLIVVGEGNKRFNIVHAELINDDNVGNDDLVWSDTDIDYWYANTIPDEMIERFCSSRDLMSFWIKRDVLPKFTPSLSPTYCGHTLGQNIKQIASHICLDTGACYKDTAMRWNKDYGLTMCETNRHHWYWISNHNGQIKQGDL